MNPMHAMHGPEFHPGSVFRPLVFLPPNVLRVALAAMLLTAMAGCTAVMLAGPKYPPSPNICRSHEVSRTDCVRPVPVTTGVAR